MHKMYFVFREVTQTSMRLSTREPEANQVWWDHRVLWQVSDWVTRHYGKLMAGYLVMGTLKVENKFKLIILRFLLNLNISGCLTSSWIKEKAKKVCVISSGV